MRQAANRYNFPVKQFNKQSLPTGDVKPVLFREKYVLLKTLEEGASSSSKLYFTFDEELKNSRITGIRVYAGDSGTVPAIWPDGLSLHVAEYQTLGFFTLTLVDEKNQNIIEDHPLMDLVSVKNLNEKVKVQFDNIRYVPDRSYVEVTNTTGWVSQVYIFFVFTYRPL